MSAAQPVYLVKGDDPALLSQSVASLAGDLVGSRPADLTVHELSEDADVTAVLDACQTPAFLTDRRVVIVRNAGRFRADEVNPLIAYLESPMPSTCLVLVGGGGVLPTRLVKAIKSVGHVVDASAPSGKARQSWVAERLRSGPVRLDRQAQSMLTDRLGDELGQLNGVLDALAAAYGEGATVGPDELSLFLGAGGVAAPWELTDAIDAGDVDTALVQLRRMLEGGQRHPLVVMATLQRHVGGLLRLDGGDITSEAEAAKVLGMSPYPAKKVMAQSRRLGSTAIARAVELVSQADVDLRGGSAWPGELVLEVLVARLAKLGPAKRRNVTRSSAA